MRSAPDKLKSATVGVVRRSGPENPVDYMMDAMFSGRQHEGRVTADTFMDRMTRIRKPIQHLDPASAKFGEFLFMPGYDAPGPR